MGTRSTCSVKATRPALNITFIQHRLAVIVGFSAIHPAAASPPEDRPRPSCGGPMCTTAAVGLNADLNKRKKTPRAGRRGGAGGY